jgi:tRNA A-37 threonylcarbamoyl transferase component Bud32
VLKEVATANISFVSMDPSSSQLISFFENDEEIRLIACHTFRIPKDAHQLPLCINTSFKILTGQIEAPKEEDKAQLQRRMSKVGKKEALAESKAMPHILKGELVETFKCQYVGSVGVGQPKGDDVVTEALTRITKLNEAHKVQPSDAEIRIYENVFSIVQLSAGEEVAVAHIRDVTFAKLSADSKQFSAILFDKRGQTYECHSTLVEPLEEGRPSIRRTIDTVQKKNIAMAKEAAASEEKKAEENKKDEEEAQTGKILGVFEALLLGVEIVPQPKGIEVCEAAYEELQAKKVSPIGAYIQLGTESIKVLDALTHEIIENKVLKEVCFTSVIGSKGQILTYITKDDELKIYSCFLFQCGGERAAQIANTFGDAFKLLAEEQKKLGENPFAGVGERLTPPADLFSIQIHRSDLIPAKIIGAGAFGQVYLADQKIEGGLVRRAVKMLRGAASDADRKIFIRETQFMRHLNHENLVQLVGVAMQQKPWLMVLDYCQFGDLRGVLQGCKSRKIVLNFAEVLNLAMQVAAGMQYMAERRYIHMDLAARNCLVAKGTLVKVADFGLSRSLPKGQSVWKSDTVMRLPIKWTAIESLDDRMFSEASDVWAYGILLWEITAFVVFSPASSF